MKTPLTILGRVTLLSLMAALLSLPAQAGGCSSGKCGGGGGGSVGTFKGKASRLPTITQVGEDQFKAGRKTFFVGSNARITVDGERAEMSELAVGMRVMVTSRVVAKGDTVETSIYQASRITARTPDDAPTAKKDGSRSSSD